MKLQGILGVVEAFQLQLWLMGVGSLYFAFNYYYYLDNINFHRANRKLEKYVTGKHNQIE